MRQPPHMRRRVTYVLLGLGLALSVALLAPELSQEETAPTPVPNQEVELFAPQLLSPVDGLQTYPTNLILEWSWPQGLGENQLYTVRFWREGDSPGDIAYTADTRFSISGFLESSQPGRFYWQVAVLQLDDQGVFESMGSGWSQVWQMERIPPSPVPTETPVPIVPTPTPTPNPQYTEPDPYDRPPNDVESLISIRTGRGAEVKREELIELLWGEDGLPDTLPEVEEDIEVPEEFADLPNLRQLDRLTVSMDLGIESYPLLFHPQESNDRLILYHEGSDGDLSYGLETIQFFLEQGYTVLGFEMPLLGHNNNPIVDIPRLGRVQLPGYLHFHLYYVENLIEQGAVLKLFIEPVVVALNYADTLGFADYAMIGISGGGWTTHLVAAVDTRIIRSYPVAGSQPEFVRFEGRYALTDLMAYVQLLPGVFPQVNYLELYILGAYGQGRKEMMVINQFDPCCFGGLRYLSWYDAVLERMDRLGAGEFEIFLDVTHEQHIISPAARQAVLDDLESE
jgi:hypothetical protein